MPKSQYFKNAKIVHTNKSRLKVIIFKKEEKQVIIKNFKKKRVYGCCHNNEHKQGRVGLQAISVTPRPQPYTAVF